MFINRSFRVKEDLVFSELIEDDIRQNENTGTLSTKIKIFIEHVLVKKSAKITGVFRSVVNSILLGDFTLTEKG